MKILFRILRSEAVKLRRTKLLTLLVISPLLAAMTGMMVTLRSGPETAWQELFAMMAMTHAILFLPLMTGLLGANMCRYEHANGGWKQTLALPVTRTSLYVGKLIITCLMTAFTQLLFFIAVIAVGMIRAIDAPIPLSEIFTYVASGWIATLPLAALQIFMSTIWASFAAALTINVIFTLPNLLIIQSETYGPYYPWAQPGLAMLPMSSADQANPLGLNIPLESLLLVVGGSFLLFFISGLTYFRRKDVA